MSKIKFLGFALLVYFLQVEINLKAEKITLSSFEPTQEAYKITRIDQPVFLPYARFPEPIVRYNGIVTDTPLGVMNGQIDLNLYQPGLNKTQ